MLILIQIICLFFIYFVCRYITKVYPFAKFYISLPYLASLCLICMFILLTLLNLDPLPFPKFLERVTVSSFLFTVGIQIFTFLNTTFLKRVIMLLIISGFIIITMDVIQFIVETPYDFVLGSIFFANNVDFIKKVSDKMDLTVLTYWGSVQLLIVFYFTPLFLKLSEKFLINLRKNISIHPHRSEPLITGVTKKGVSHFLILWVIICIIIWISSSINSQVYFVYDFVFAMLFGIFYASFIRIQGETITKTTTNLINQIGTFHLYIFILITIWQQFIIQTEHFRIFFSLQIFNVIVIKTIVIGILSLYVIKITFSKSNEIDKLVGVIALWTFSLNAPVVCMHGMKTASNRFDASSYIVFIVPPVILWLVNYMHLWLFLALQK
ncbi:hypothetical protein [Metabacillus indicus]|uniref:hypothetical protein n=1 Tax=Metabacillus indicus TaxID=246786 RepID=UPI003CF7A3DA